MERRLGGVARRRRMCGGLCGGAWLPSHPYGWLSARRRCRAAESAGNPWCVRWQLGAPGVGPLPRAHSSRSQRARMSSSAAPSSSVHGRRRRVVAGRGKLPYALPSRRRRRCRRRCFVRRWASAAGLRSGVSSPLVPRRRGGECSTLCRALQQTRAAAGASTQATCIEGDRSPWTRRTCQRCP